MEKLGQNLVDTLNLYWTSFINLLPNLVIGLVVLAVFVLLALGISSVIRRHLFRSGSENRIVIQFTARVVKLLLIVLGLVIALHLMGYKGAAGGLLAGAGVSAIIIGFAFKDIGENFLAGIILVFNRPFAIGDTVTIGDKMGVVKELSFRNTHIKSFDGKDIYVPNASIIKNDLSNHTRDGLLRLNFIIGIDYNNSIERARKLILENLYNTEGILQSQPPIVVVEAFSANSVDLNTFFWVDTFDYKNSALLLKSQVMEKVKDVLMSNNIGLPANIQELKMYREEDVLSVKMTQ